jgi:DNA-directed RNA polymerase subunit RPC12/RpoP
MFLIRFFQTCDPFLEMLIFIAIGLFLGVLLGLRLARHNMEVLGCPDCGGRLMIDRERNIMCEKCGRRLKNEF